MRTVYTTKMNQVKMLVTYSNGISQKFEMNKDDELIIHCEHDIKEIN